MPIELPHKFADPLVFDTSVVFNVGHHGGLENLIQHLTKEYTLLVTPKVAEETHREEQRRKYYQEFVDKYFEEMTGKISTKNADAIVRLATFLGSGELEVIVLALDTGGTAVIDERIARREARALNITVIGTIGLLQHAIQQGWMSEEHALERVRLMQENGFNIRPIQQGHSFFDYLKTLSE